MPPSIRLLLPLLLTPALVASCQGAEPSDEQECTGDECGAKISICEAKTDCDDGEAIQEEEKDSATKGSGGNESSSAGGSSSGGKLESGGANGSGGADLDGESGGADGSGGTDGSGGADGSGGDGSGGDGRQEEWLAGLKACPSDAEFHPIVASPESGGTFESQLDFDVQKISPTTDMSFDWGELTSDFLKMSLDPTTDIGKVDLVVFRRTPEQVSEGIHTGDFTLTDGAIGVSYIPTMGETSAPLSDFTSFGEAVSLAEFETILDPSQFPRETTTYALLATRDDSAIAIDVQMIHAFQLDDSSTETRVQMTNSSSTIIWDADITSPAPTTVPAAQADLDYAWSELPYTSFDTDFDPLGVTEVLVGRFEMTPEELEADFLLLESNAKELYRAPVSSSSEINLEFLIDEAGNNFPGINSDGTWLLALTGSSNASPGPWYITVLEACR